MTKLDEVSAVILVGGPGTRLQSVIADRPKVLAAVSGKPFLAYLLDQISAAGIRHTILCVGYLGEQVKAVFGNSYAEMSLTYSQEKVLLGTGGALRLALPLIKAEAFIAMNGDSFCDVDLKDLWIWHHAHQANATMVLTPKADTTRYGCVSLSVDGSINSFEEKGSSTGAGWVNAGIYVFNSENLQTIPVEKIVSLEYNVFPRLIGQRLYGYQSQGRFLDIGTPESYAQADSLFSKG